MSIRLSLTFIIGCRYTTQWVVEVHMISKRGVFVLFLAFRRWSLNLSRTRLFDSPIYTAGFSSHRLHMYNFIHSIFYMAAPTKSCLALVSFSIGGGRHSMQYLACDGLDPSLLPNLKDARGRGRQIKKKKKKKKIVGRFAT